MTDSTPQNLEDAIRQAGEGWLIDTFSPSDRAIDHIRQTIEDVRQEAMNRFQGNTPDLTEDSLVQDYCRRPQQVRGFFQALGGTRTPEMLLMVWRIIQGMEIKNVSISYQRQQSFAVKVILVSPYGEEDPPYTSNNINDFALFRHIGLSEIGTRPVMDGFYAMRVGR